jgi:hypothetical protein
MPSKCRKPQVGQDRCPSEKLTAAGGLWSETGDHLPSVRTSAYGE